MGHARHKNGNDGHLEARYANYFEVGHNAAEFIIDCGQLYPGRAEPWFHTRLVVAPIHIRELHAVLERSLKQYEEAFGSLASQTENET